jgi:tetratricopeptide (TPR) repeat protein
VTRGAARRDVRLRAIAVTAVAVLALGAAVLWFDRGTQAERRDDFDAGFRDAVTLLQACEYDRAAAALHDLLRQAPRLPELHVNMGYALLGLKNYAAARDFFLGAIRLRPGQANAYYGLAESLEGAGNLRGAIEAMRTYVHLSRPDDEFSRKANAAIWEWESALGKAGKR